MASDRRGVIDAKSSHNGLTARGVLGSIFLVIVIAHLLVTDPTRPGCTPWSHWPAGTGYLARRYAQQHCQVSYSTSRGCHRLAKKARLYTVSVMSGNKYYTVNFAGYKGAQDISFTPAGGTIIVSEDRGPISLHEGSFVLAVDGPATTELIDLCSLQHDLEQAKSWSSMYLEQHSKGPDKETPWMGPLFESSIICYGRSFNTGKSQNKRAQRPSMNKYVKGLSEELQDKHRRLIELRNRHVGHRVENEETIIFADFDKCGKFLHASPIYSIMGHDPQSMSDMASVLEELLPIVSEAISNELSVLQENCHDVILTDTEIPQYDHQQKAWYPKKIIST